MRLTVVALVLSWLGDTLPRCVAALTLFAGSSIARIRPVLVAAIAHRDRVDHVRRA